MIATTIHGKIVPLPETVSDHISQLIVLACRTERVATNKSAKANAHDEMVLERDRLADAIGKFAQEYAEEYHQSKVRELPLSIELAKMATAALQAFTSQAEGIAILDPKPPLGLVTDAREPIFEFRPD